MGSRTFCKACCISALVLLCTVWTFSQEANDLIAAMERLSSLDQTAPESLIDSISEQIRQDPSAACVQLLAKLSDPDLTENQTAFYIWALGLTRDPKAADDIISVAKIAKAERIKENCLRALALIGGKRSGKFLMSAYEREQDKDTKFEILNLLAQMQYEPALAKSQQVLKSDYNEYYWQSIFIFGKMGDKSVPFLLKQIDNSNKNVRMHAISALGRWLIEPTAADPLRKRYWVEEEPEIRWMILNSLECLISDPNETAEFLNRVLSREKDTNLLKVASEPAAQQDGVKQAISEFAQQKRLSHDEFSAEYEKLYESAGKKGNMEILSQTSTREDEPKLKKLRERILWRNSDECFADYQVVNKIIMLNRLLPNQPRKS